METTYKDLTNFLVDLGVEQIGHTDKSYLAHLIGVYNDLKAWGASEEVCRGGMFHSIYGTQKFQGFTLPLERRGEIRELIGERAEWLAYMNCAMYRPTFDEAAIRNTPPYVIRDRITEESIELTEQDFDDLCTIHLCDWLEQVPRCKQWDERRVGYRAMAERLQGIAIESYDRVFSLESVG